MSAVLAKLEAMKNQTTKYEVVATNKITGQKVLVGYTARKGRNGLFKMVAHNGKDAVALLGGGVDNIYFEKKASDGAVMGDWSIKFSGRTKRQAVVEGELAFFIDVIG